MDEIWDRQIEADLVSGKLDHLIARAEAEILKKRLDRNRPMVSVTIRMPEDVIEDLKQIAPLLGFSGYQPLVRAYIGQGTQF